MSLTLVIDSPDLISELSRYGDSSEQRQIALLALSIGLKAIGASRGEIDLETFQQKAEQILEQVEVRIESVFEEHSAALLQEFSLDNADSAINRLSNLNRELYTDLRTSLETSLVRRQEQRRSAVGGFIFEDEVGKLLKDIIGRSGDKLDAVGDFEGTISKNKVGDFVISLNSDSLAAGERIVIEAKRDSTFTRSRVISECHVACKNRDAQVAIFVWDRQYGEAKHQPPLSRDENHIIVLWDAEDPSTDLYVNAAFWLARSAMMPKSAERRIARVQEGVIRNAFQQIAGLSTTLEKVKKSGEDVVKKGQEISSSILTVQSLLSAQVDILREQIEALIQ